MAFIIKWNLSIGIVAFMAYVVQKIMGKRLGHYWRKIVWILLTLKMCFPFWRVTEKFRQHPFMISMPAYYIGEQNQKTAIMTKMGNVSIRGWMSGEKFLPYIWIAGMILCLLFHAIQYRIWKKRIFAECKKMQKNSVLEALKKASEVCKIKKKEITDIQVLKKGMTNRSFSFVCRNKKYIMRIPGEGTDQLINRKHEADVYHTLEGKGICDDPIYINSKNGYKITKYLEGVRTCDCMNQDDLIVCMKKLKEFHDMDLKVNHTFNIFEQIQYYEELWDGTPSIYRDYKKTKDNVLSLKSYIEEHRNRWCLTHIDAVPDNFLFYDDGMQLTDWEYSGMQDPHVDIAMFCIYSLYDRRQIDDLIDIYFDGKCERNTRIKIYCYIAVCGLLWSNWCEYKRKLGVEFGEYSLCQYRYAKEYYKIVKEELTYES